MQACLPGIAAPSPVRTVCNIDAHGARVEGPVLNAGQRAEVAGGPHFQVEAAGQLLNGAFRRNVPVGLPHAAQQRHPMLLHCCSGPDHA